MVGQRVVVELKSDLSIEGTLSSVDQYLNIKLRDIKVLNEQTHPHLASVKNCFIRGSVVRYVHLPKDSVDLQLLQDASRVEARETKKMQHQQKLQQIAAFQASSTSPSTPATSS
ncbi:MAG: U6 snRNA-associated Sm-like protein LSm2 [archaeon]|nr:U6 snRNA-associated Sm-like protein LSm2 [archaeon]